MRRITASNENRLDFSDFSCFSDFSDFSGFSFPHTSSRVRSTTDHMARFVFLSAPNTSAFGIVSTTFMPLLTITESFVCSKVRMTSSSDFFSPQMFTSLMFALPRTSSSSLTISSFFIFSFFLPFWGIVLLLPPW